MNRTGYALALLVFGTGGAAHAGDATPPAAAPPDATVSAAPAPGPAPGAKLAAKKAFVAGSDAYDDKKYDDALRSFEESYAAVVSPNSGLMIARTLRELGRLPESYTAYLRVATDAAGAEERYASAVKAAKEEQVDVRGRVALVVVRLAEERPGAVVKLGDRSLTAAELGQPLPVAPGAVVISAEAPDGWKASVSSQLTAGVQHDVLLAAATQAAPAAAPPPQIVKVVVREPGQSGPSLRTWAFVAGGVGVVGLGAFGVFGAMSRSTFGDLESDCPGGRCPADRQDDIDAGKRDQLIANIGLGVGILGLGAGAALFLLDGGSSSERAASGLRVGVGPGSVTVGGTL